MKEWKTAIAEDDSASLVVPATTGSKRKAVSCLRRYLICVILTLRVLLGCER
jgi:hypothetical protein